MRRDSDIRCPSQKRATTRNVAKRSAPARDVGERAAERMRNQALQNDESALHLAAGIVRDWIKGGTQRITRGLLERALAAHRLYAERPERSVTVYMETIKKRRFDLEPD